MGKPAYKALIKSTSSEPVSDPLELFVGIGTIEVGLETYHGYRVSNPLKRIISSNHTFELYDDLIALEPSQIFKIDYLSGTVYLTQAIGEVLNGNFSYFTSSEIVGANSYSLEIGGDVLDDTNFKDARENGGFRTRTLGLTDVTFSIDRYSDHGQVFSYCKRNRERVLVEVTPGGEDCGPNGGTYRGWFVVESDGHSGDIGDLESESITFNLDGKFEDSFVFIPWEE
jgi:hypothetical protein